jgi:S-adenosylmethionine hydrolase
MHLPRRGLLLLPVLVAAACARRLPDSPATTTGNTIPTVLFLTDFGTQDGAVAVCKGVMWDILPPLRIVDLSHDVPPYDIHTAAEVLEQAIPFYGRGTVAVAVVDPGVGGTRRSIAVVTRTGKFLVGPDNGIFTLVLATEGFDRAVELRNARFQRLPDPSYTFHGRDVFAPVAAHLAAGVPLDSLGPPIQPLQLDVRPAVRTGQGKVAGIVRYVETPFGNVVTNIPPALLAAAGLRVGDTLDVRIGTRSARLPWTSTFSAVSEGQPLALLHSRALLSFSVNQGSFAEQFGVRRGDSITVST